MFTEIYLDNANAVNTKPVRFDIFKSVFARVPEIGGQYTEFNDEPVVAIEELTADCENRWQDDRHLKYDLYRVETIDEFEEPCYYYIAIEREEDDE